MNRCAIIYLLTLVTQGAEINSGGGYHEPQCYSRFDYEYKVLHKLMTLDEAQKGLTETLKTHENEQTKQKLSLLEETQKSLADTLRTRENEIQDLKTEVKRLTDLSTTNTVQAATCSLWTLQIANVLENHDGSTCISARTDYFSSSFKELGSVYSEEQPFCRQQLAISSYFPPLPGFSRLLLKNDFGEGQLVAFTAYIDSTKSLTSDPFVFDKVLLNEPSAYDQTTGVFTCPVAGVYVISVVVAARNSAEVYARLKVNGDTILEVVAEGTKSSHDLQGNNLGIFKLNEGDRAWVSGGGSLPGNSGGNTNTRTSSFSGFLLYPTAD